MYTIFYSADFPKDDCIERIKADADLQNSFLLVTRKIFLMFISESWTFYTAWDRTS